MLPMGAWSAGRGQHKEPNVARPDLVAGKYDLLETRTNTEVARIRFSDFWEGLLISARADLTPRLEAVRCISHRCSRRTRTLSTVRRMAPCPYSTVLVGQPKRRCCAAKRY